MSLTLQTIVMTTKRSDLTKPKYTVMQSNCDYIYFTNILPNTRCNLTTCQNCSSYIHGSAFVPEIGAALAIYSCVIGWIQANICVE